MTTRSEHANTPDIELVKLALEDADNYLYLMERYEAPLLRYIRRISNVSDDDAQDLLQEVYIKSYQNLNSFDTKLKFSTWIYRIAHNVVISNFRKLQARPDVAMSVDDEVLVNSLVSDLKTDAEVNHADSSEAIYAALSKLDKKYREVLILKYFEDKSYEEISDIIKKPSGTVGTLINRAKNKLKKELNQLEEKGE
ncbi:RNA polymerase sigma factor [Patescibacteria group bacterium]